MIGALLGQVIQCLACLAKDVVSPSIQLGPEIGPVGGIHEFLVLREDKGTKIDLLTQRDSPEEHLIAAVYSPMEAAIQASD
ncbi:hypothetical protein D3C80_1882740 [compost metagenome]